MSTYRGKKRKRYNKFQLNLAVQKLNLPLTNTEGSRNYAFNIHTDPIVYGGLHFSLFRIIPEGEGRTDGKCEGYNDLVSV